MSYKCKCNQDFSEYGYCCEFGLLEQMKEMQLEHMKDFDSLKLKYRKSIEERDKHLDSLNRSFNELNHSINRYDYRSDIFDIKKILAGNSKEDRKTIVVLKKIIRRLLK